MVCNTSLGNPFKDIEGIEQGSSLDSDKQGGGPGYGGFFRKKKVAENEKQKELRLKALMQEEKYEQAKDRMLQFHKMIKDLIIENSKIDPQPARVPTLRNWSHLKKYEIFNQQNNFLARVYKCADNVVVVYQVNTKNIDYEKVQDYFIRGYILPQFKQAIEVCEKVRKAYPREKIYFTGYALGGTIAEYIAFNRRRCFGVTFNGLGVATLYPGYFGPEHVPNIINYVTTKEDKIFRKNHFGLTRMLYVNDYTGQEFGGLATHPKNQSKHVMNDFDHLELFKTAYTSKA